MCEIPSNVILADEFAEIFDGFSIGSNDLTQLVLGVDRDSEIVAPIFDERNPAVKAMVARSSQGAGEEAQGRHLWPGAERLSRVRTVPGRAGHRQHLAQSGYGAPCGFWNWRNNWAEGSSRASWRPEVAQ
jgi:hypothetical protein